MSVMFCAMTELAPIAEIVTVNDARTATNMTLHRVFNSVVHMHMSVSIFRVSSYKTQIIRLSIDECYTQVGWLGFVFAIKTHNRSWRVSTTNPRVKLFSFGKLTLLTTLYRFKYVTTTYLLFAFS
jgi:hypothetical protein